MNFFFFIIHVKTLMKTMMMMTTDRVHLYMHRATGHVFYTDFHVL